MDTGTGGTSLLFIYSLMIVKKLTEIYLLGNRKSFNSFRYTGTNSTSMLLIHSLKNFK